MNQAAHEEQAFYHQTAANFVRSLRDAMGKRPRYALKPKKRWAMCSWVPAKDKK